MAEHGESRIVSRMGCNAAPPGVLDVDPITKERLVKDGKHVITIGRPRPSNDRHCDHPL